MGNGVVESRIWVCVPSIDVIKRYSSTHRDFAQAAQWRDVSTASTLSSEVVPV